VSQSSCDHNYSYGRNWTATKARLGIDGTLGDLEGENVVQTAEAMEEATRALASIAGPGRDAWKAEGQETGGQDVGLITSQGTLMAESIAVDGAQQVRGADDVRVSNVQSVQGFGSRASNGSGGNAGAMLQHGGAAEDVGAELSGAASKLNAQAHRVAEGEGR